MKKLLRLTICVILCLPLFMSGCSKEDDMPPLDISFRYLTLSQIQDHIRGEWIEAKVTDGFPGSAEERVRMLDQVAEPYPLRIDGNRMKIYHEDPSATTPGWYSLRWWKEDTVFGKMYCFVVNEPHVYTIGPRIPLGISDGMLIISSCVDEVCVNIYYTKEI